MAARTRGCSGLGGIAGEDDAEFRAILDALFCACDPASQDRRAILRRDLFRLTEAERLTLPDAARRLAIPIAEAKDMREEINRDIKVLRALGVFAAAPAPAEKPDEDQECRCGTRKPARRDPDS